MIRVQHGFNRFENIIIQVFYFSLRALLSFAFSFLTAKCYIFGELSPFSIILLSVSSNIGLIPTACFMGSSLGYLTSAAELTIFKYITAITMVYVVYMVFKKTTHIIKGNTAIISAVCCFTSGFLFLLVGKFNLFSVLLLICEGVFTCCCIYFVSYATSAFKKCCYLSSKELISVIITLILILLTVQNLEIFHMNLSRLIGFILLFVALYCLKTSHAAVFGCGLAFLLAAIENGGESVFTAIIAGTLASCLFSSFSHRLSVGAFALGYFSVLFFFGKFPWSYWYYGETIVAIMISFLLPKEKLRNFLSDYIAVKRYRAEVNNAENKTLLENCRNACFSFCPKAQVCYEKNIQSIEELLLASEEKLEAIEFIQEHLPFCIKTHGMQNSILMQKMRFSPEDLSILVKNFCRAGKVLENRLRYNCSLIHFLRDEENEIRKNALDQGIIIDEIEFTENEQSCKKCKITFSLQKEILPERVLKSILSKYFENGLSIKIIKFSEFSQAIIKEKTNYIADCVAICKKRSGEELCGDNAIGFFIDKNTYCLLLIDGIGSGENARFQSKSAIQIISNLLKNKVPLRESLGVFRSIGTFIYNQEFPSLDISTIDLKNGKADFLKSGAFDSYHIQGEKLKTLHGGGLPFGLGESDNIKKNSIQLKNGDFIIMASDGLSCFDNPEALILMCKNDDPAAYAQNILRQIMDQSNGKIQDDITIIVSKIRSEEE